ncbi:putative mitochondrial methylglutaconyl-CoA hydratase [Geopyxis carbonaria]|nr:putative mitochondrial methylglutaconyl-CoA hydratase [Geopyxis carbonaria]
MSYNRATTDATRLHPASSRKLHQLDPSTSPPPPSPPPPPPPPTLPPTMLRPIRLARLFSTTTRLHNALPPSPAPLITLTHPTPSISHLSLTSPRNALSLPFISTLTTHLHSLPRTTRAVIISSAHPTIFCAGADLKERLTLSLPQTREFLRTLNAALDLLASLPVPTIAAIDGYALGGGLELALACDLRVVGCNAVLGLPEARIGVIPGAGGSWRLPAVVGAGVARDLALTGRRVGVQEAVRIGLATRMAADGEGVVETAMGVARECEHGAPVSLRALKMCLGRGAEEEGAAYEGLLEEGDRMEGLRAFGEKRRPVWGGDAWEGWQGGRGGEGGGGVRWGCGRGWAD